MSRSSPEVPDRHVLQTRNEAPTTPGVTSQTTPRPATVDAQARRKLAELLAQRYADLECTAIGNPHRPC
jgi:hypothetical protein